MPHGKCYPAVLNKPLPTDAPWLVTGSSQAEGVQGMRVPRAFGVLAVITMLSACTPGAEQADTPAPAPEQEVATTDAPTGPGADGRSAAPPADLVSTLEQDLPTDPSRVLAESSEFYGEDAKKGLPVGSDVQVHPDTWSSPPDSERGVIGVTVTPPGGEPADYLALVALEDGQWKVVATLAAEAGE